MARQQQHGGPDAQNDHASKNYGIGSNRLAITDPTGGHQPYRFGDSIFVALNGEIYNHDDLRLELQQDGIVFQDRCDGSILPYLYMKYGKDFVEHLDGMFSIAVIDLRDALPILILAVDSSGIKPLYYAYSSNTHSFGFSSEVPPLISFGIAPHTINRHKIDHYLTVRSGADGWTLLDNVYSMQPGTIISVKVGREPTSHSYVSKIKYDDKIPTTHSGVGDALRELLSWEVSRLITADANVCSVNSGGLDSSLLTALSDKVSQYRPINSFHVSCQGDWPFDERHHARSLAESLGCDHHEILIDPNKIQDLVPKMVSHLGLPNCAPHSFSTYCLFKDVAQSGFRVAITGEGSDELFCGHSRMINAITSNNDDWVSNYLDSIGPCTEHVRSTLYCKDYSTELLSGGKSAKQDLAEYIDSRSSSRSAAIRNFEQKKSLPFYILHRVETLAMASAVEVRVPFCQPRVINFSWKINPNFLISDDKRGKSPVYSAARNLIPDSIFNRPKQPFTLPVLSLMHKGSKLLDYAQDNILTSQMREEGVFDFVELEKMIKQYKDDPTRDSALTIWSLMVYSVWKTMIHNLRLHE